MTVLNDLDRFHLVMDAIIRLPQTGGKGINLKQQLKDKLIEYKRYIDKHGEDLPEIRNWKWDLPKLANPCKMGRSARIVDTRTVTKTSIDETAYGVNTP
jgi:hypothetical protein